MIFSAGGVWNRMLVLLLPERLPIFTLSWGMRAMERDTSRLRQCLCRNSLDLRRAVFALWKFLDLLTPKRYMRRTVKRKGDENPDTPSAALPCDRPRGNSKATRATACSVCQRARCCGLEESPPQLDVWVLWLPSKEQWWGMLGWMQSRHPTAVYSFLKTESF